MELSRTSLRERPYVTNRECLRLEAVCHLGLMPGLMSGLMSLRGLMSLIVSVLV